MTSLNAVPAGTKKEVKWITGDRAEADGLRSLGFEEGNIVTVINSIQGSVIVAVNDLRYALSRDAAYRIKVG